MQAMGQAGQNEAKVTVDNVASLLHTNDVARAVDVVTRIRGALAVDAKRMRELAEEMNKHAEAYNRYVALQRDAKAHEQSAQALTALLGAEGFKIARADDKSDSIGNEIDIVPSPRELRDKAALWEHIEQYLRFVPEAQVNEILEFLAWMRIETSRQAIESAIRTHPKVFRVKKRGRDKFISLK